MPHQHRPSPPRAPKHRPCHADFPIPPRLSNLLFLAFALAGCAAAPPAAAQLELRAVRVAAELQLPVYATAPPGDAARLFIVLQRGQVRILKEGQLLANPFLDIDHLVPDISGWDERGLLGLAFHPAYASNGFFYVNYTALSGATVIARYSVSADPDVADPGSAAILLTIDQPFANHNGGTLAFGPDGYLYIGMGDGGSAGDPGDRAQDDGELLGKMLRIDVDGGAPYAIPPDNPYAGPGLPRDEIWAKGLRNPYRFSFDRATGDLYIADVGQTAWEEVNFQPAGAPGGRNYGWRIMEGAHCYDPPAGCPVAGLTLPVWEYDHDTGCSITGGVVYRGAAIPELQGHYFFSDFCTARIWAFRMQGGAAADFRDLTSSLLLEPGQSIDYVASFAEDGLGEMHIVDRGSGGDGEIFKVVRRTPTGVQGNGQGSLGGVKSIFRRR